MWSTWQQMGTHHYPTNIWCGVAVFYCDIFKLSVTFTVETRVNRGERTEARVFLLQWQETSHAASTTRWQSGPLHSFTSFLGGRLLVEIRHAETRSLLQLTKIYRLSSIVHCFLNVWVFVSTSPPILWQRGRKKRQQINRLFCMTNSALVTIFHYPKIKRKRKERIRCWLSGWRSTRRRRRCGGEKRKMIKKEMPASFGGFWLLQEVVCLFMI